MGKSEGQLAETLLLAAANWLIRAEHQFMWGEHGTIASG